MRVPRRFFKGATNEDQVRRRLRSFPRDLSNDVLRYLGQGFRLRRRSVSLARFLRRFVRVLFIRRRINAKYRCGAVLHVVIRTSRDCSKDEVFVRDGVSYVGSFLFGVASELPAWCVVPRFYRGCRVTTRSLCYGDLVYSFSALIRGRFPSRGHLAKDERVEDSRRRIRVKATGRCGFFRGAVLWVGSVCSSSYPRRREEYVSNVKCYRADHCCLFVSQGRHGGVIAPRCQVGLLAPSIRRDRVVRVKRAVQFILRAGEGSVFPFLFNGFGLLLRFQFLREDRPGRVRVLKVRPV